MTRNSRNFQTILRNLGGSAARSHSGDAALGLLGGFAGLGACVLGRSGIHDTGSSSGSDLFSSILIVMIRGVAELVCNRTRLR